MSIFSRSKMKNRSANCKEFMKQCVFFSNVKKQTFHAWPSRLLPTVVTQHYFQSKEHIISIYGFACYT